MVFIDDNIIIMHDIVLIIIAKLLLLCKHISDYYCRKGLKLTTLYMPSTCMLTIVKEQYLNSIN